MPKHLETKAAFAGESEQFHRYCQQSLKASPWPFCSTQPSLYDQQCPDGSDVKCLRHCFGQGCTNPLINLTPGFQLIPCYHFPQILDTKIPSSHDHTTLVVCPAAGLSSTPQGKAEM